MTEEEFLEMTKEKAQYRRVKNNNYNKATEYRFDRKNWVGKKPGHGYYSLDDYIYIEWCINYEPEKYLDDLDDFLMEICPNITLFQYKMLTRKVVKSDAWTQYGYEDDDKDTIHSCKYAKLRDLYDALKEMELLK